MKTNIYLTVIIALLSMIGISCKNDTVRNAADLNYVDAVNIGSTQIFLYVERPDNLEIIVPFSTFLDFSRFDLTNVREGTLKIRTGSSGKGGKIVWDAVPLDLEAYNYDKLLLAWRNSESVSHLVIHTPPETTVVDTDWTGTDTINLYDLVAGIDFELQGWDSMNVAEDMIFSIWGLKSTFGTKDYMELFYGPTEYGHYRISFIKSAYSATSTMEKRGLAWVDENPDSTGFMINLEASDDTIFERILSDCAEAIFRYSLKDKSLLGDELDYELAFIDSCALPNIKKYLGDVLLSYTLDERPRRYKRISVDGNLDNEMVLYTNINETVEKLGKVGTSGDDLVVTAIPTFLTGDPILTAFTAWFTGKTLNNSSLLDLYLKKLVNQGVKDFSPGLFSNLILHYTDYLLYAGIVCLFDDDFNSRYFNALDGIVAELHTLFDVVKDAIHRNNIVIRFYAAASLYDFMRGKDRGYYARFGEYYEAMTDSSGEYGEGFAYLNYMNDIIFPVLYLATQETYTFGPNKGLPWADRTTLPVQLCIRNSESILNASDKWGEIPAFDDGFNLTPWLAPMAVIAGNGKYLRHSSRNSHLHTVNAFENDLLGMLGMREPEFQLLTYPFNKTFPVNDDFNPGDSLYHCGSIVKLHHSDTTPDYIEQISLTLIAESNPAAGKTHDKIDHGAIQLNRLVDRGDGDVHVNHLLINPGYPGFDEDKRNIDEWKFGNQNSLMMYNNDIGLLDDTLDSTVPVNVVDDEFASTIDEPFNPEAFGGMSGYKYKSQDEIADIINSVVFDSEILSNLGSSMSKKTLKGDGGGRSEVIRKFRNGVQTKITYEYRYPTRIEPVYSETELKSYNVYTELRSDCCGYREVYQLGRSFYVIDRFPAEDHPTISDLTFATSWNMPENTDSIPGRPGCFEGVRENTDTPESRIQIAIKGYTDTAVAMINRGYNLTTNYDFGKTSDDHIVKQLLATNHDNTNRTMLACITCCDGTESFPAILNDSYRSMFNRTYWERHYRDGSVDVIVYNPHNTTYTYDEIESDAYIFIVHLDKDGGGNARLYGCTTVSTDSHSIVYQKGGQCDIQM